MNTRFDNCQTMDEAKKLWRQESMKYHPDLHPEDREGYTELFKQLNNEFSYFCSNFTRRTLYEDQRKAHNEGRKSRADYHNVETLAEELRVRIEWALNNLPADVDVELCGLWIWLSGNTKPVKETIKGSGLGFKFSGRKQAWFYDSVPSYNHGKKWTLDEIRSYHGSRKFERTTEEREERVGIPATAMA